MQTWWDELAHLEHEHPGLVSGSRELIAGLSSARHRFAPSMLDYLYADRLVQLARHLDAVGMLIAADHYASAFTVLRTALEHALTDALLLNATKRRDRYEGASPEWEAAQRLSWEQGDPGTEDIVAIDRHGKDVVVVTRGAYPLKNENGEVVDVVSPYRVAMEHHSPFIGKPSDQADRWMHVSTLEDRRTHAEKNRKWWESYLSWSAIKSHLVLNDIYTERDVRRLDVHYGFLSAFTHAHDDGYRTTHNGEPPLGGCHFCRELAMLYVAVIASLEARSAMQHCTARDTAFDGGLDDALATVQDASSHFWFPPGQPSLWDRQREVMQRQADSKQMEHRVAEPGDLADDDIPYYGQPMDRLVAMHNSSTEIATGLAYTSPWPQARYVIHP